MPQTFQVLRCFKCLVFQVHLTKKSNKWECKLCGEKQSLKRHYGVGTGKDCRAHVQKLNSLRGEIDELKCSRMRRNVESDVDSDAESEQQNLESQQAAPQTILAKESKWSNYVEEPEVVDDNKEPMCLGDAEVVLEIPKKRRKQFKKTSRNYSSRNNNVELESKITQNNHCNDEDNNILHFKAPEFKVNTKKFPESKVEPDILSGSQINQNENFKPKAPIKKFVPPVINKNSKWAQFAEEEEQDMTHSQSMTASQSDLMFSLCDDGDLDSVLDL